ncbi:fungal-specific transcription factor [Rhexocercosporidium sp. MPI-PUGE-AT-0058]|nr:fungal-specific transcription factor [Rhexocercosporidium sp. MPI-PUGE-AT-0058]
MKRRYQEARLDLQPPSSIDPGISSDTPIKTKSRACSECKKHKIKCQVDDGQEKCRRCLRQNLPCVTNNSLQKFVEDDTQWKATAAAQASRLETAMADVLRQLRLPKLDTYGSGQLPVTSRPVEIAAATRENSREPDLDGGRIVSAPSDALYEVTRIRTLRSDHLGEEAQKDNLLESDFIARGVLRLNIAESLFESFNYTMNQLLWGGVVMRHSSLESARRSSSLLSAAILTVSALHIPGRSGALEACYEEYISLVQRSTIKRRCTLDDIRGLCIGAFWLPDLSWRLSGLAVRLAVEMGLHQSFRRMSNEAANNYERAQLWFLLYVCDHQFSTTYGRPSSIHEDDTITGYEVFLQCPSTVPGDVRLMSQVALFILHSQVFRQFGTDSDQSVSEEDFELLRHFNIELDKWRSMWAPRCTNNQYVHAYPSKGVALHYYFAKFQFNSLALRTISPVDAVSLSTSRKESANLAISSAMSTLAFILDEPDVRNNIIGVPLFAHTMLAFSAVFLLKVTLKWNSNNSTNQNFSTSPSAASTAGLHINAAAVEDLVDRVIMLLRNAVSSEKHLTKHIAGGLSKMLASFRISVHVSINALQENGQRQDKAAPQLQNDHSAMNAQISHSDATVTSFPLANEALPNDFGFGFDEAWQDFPATTLDFLTSQWQDSTNF